MEREERTDTKKARKAERLKKGGGGLEKKIGRKKERKGESAANA